MWFLIKLFFSFYMLATNPSMIKLVAHFEQIKHDPRSGLIDVKATPYDDNGKMVIESEWTSIGKLMKFAHANPIHLNLQKSYAGYHFIIDHDALNKLPKNRRIRAINVFDPSTKTFTLTVELAGDEHEEVKEE